VTAKIAPVTSLPRYPQPGTTAPRRDLARFGTAILIAASFSALQVFVIPRKLDIATYGHYRLFLVYAGYLGVLHFGLADGAFLRWAGSRPDTIGREWRQIGRWVITAQLFNLLVALVIAVLLTEPLPRLFVVALAATALGVNMSTLASFALQAAGDFRGAGRVAMLTNGAFVAGVALLPAHRLPAVLALYVGSCASAALYGAIRVSRAIGASEVAAHAGDSDEPALRTLLRTGAPVLGANFAAGLSQSADRLLVSSTAPITDFALYGFASTVTVASSAATQALARVALSHAARVPMGERAKFIGGFYDVIAVGFGAALVAEPLFERVVAAHLPAYVAALPILRALTLGAPFWVAVHVVLVGTLQSFGLVRRQLVVELCGVAFVALACGAALFAHSPMWKVAAAAAAAAAVTHAVGAIVLRYAVESARAQASVRFVAIIATQGAALLAALFVSGAWPVQTAVYLTLTLLPTLLAARGVREHRW
jgi:O-antigen/teichoic acid export membrane protein